MAPKLPIRRSCAAALLTLLVVAPLSAQERALWPATLGPLPVQELPGALPSLSAQTCNACHGAIHDQWAQSGHARASTDPAWKAARASLGDPPICLECHQPLLVQRANLPKSPGAGAKSANPAWDPTLSLEGVTCAACHVRDGAIIGPRELAPEDAPHPVRAEPRLRTAEACAFCHQSALPGNESDPFLDTVGEWQRSPFGQAGIACQDCHMARVGGSIAGSRFAAYASHSGLGGRSPEALRRALTVELDVPGPAATRGSTLRATALLRNTGAAHAVPTGDPAHRLEVRFELLGPDGLPPKGSTPASTWIGRVVAPEFPFATVSDDRLVTGGERPVDFSLPLDQKWPAGSYTLSMSVLWWAAAPEVLTEQGLDPAAHSVLFAQQRLPLRID